MEEIAISKFKATCLSVLDDVRRTGKPIRVTKFGKAVAEVVPAVDKPAKSWLGCMKGTVTIKGDIVGPIGAFDGWNPEKE